MEQAALPDGWPDGVDRIVLETVDSTSLEALRRAPSAPTWILAREQTSARGRRGRAWSMPRGNFAASLAWRPGCAPAQMALRSFVASLALHDVLEALGVRGLSLKWPNDVLLNEQKLAGILLEVPSPGLLVLGIGVNLAGAPGIDAVEPGATVPVGLREVTGLQLDPEPFLDALAAAFARREAQLVTWGFAPIRTDWLRHAARLGERITARLSAETVSGRFSDVDVDGCLILETEAGPRRIAAADVFFEAKRAEDA